MRISLRVIVIATTLVGLIASPINRQSRADDKTRKVVNGILRALIESQVRDRRPVAPPPGRPPVSVGRATPELIKLRTALDGHRKETAGLYGLLQRETIRQPKVRTLLADSLKVQARSEALARRSQAVQDHRLLVAEANQLDRDWRVLSYRLHNLSGLTQPCQACIGRLDGFGTEICGILKFEPQIDRRSLIRRSDALVIYLRGLVDDLEFELARSPNRSAIIVAADRIQQAAEAFADGAQEGATYEELISGYRQFLKLWQPFARTISQIRSRYVERSLLRIQEVDQSIHELLWLPRDLDRDLLLRLTSGIETEIDTIFSRVTLAMLIQLPTYDEIPGNASEFYGVCENFADCVKRRESRNDLVDAYEYLPVAWVAFSRHFRGIEHSAIRRSLSEIESRLVALREPLGVPGGFDLTKARQHAASIQHLAEHLSDDVEEWLASQKYSKDRAELEKLGTVFMHSSRKLHAALAGSPHLPTIRRLSEQCVADWSAFHDRVARCRAPNRDHLQRIEIRITGALVELEAMLL